MAENSGALLERHLNPLEPFLKKTGVVEISINGPGGVWIETAKGWQYKEVKDLTLARLNYLAQSLATLSGQSFSDEVPLLATHLPVYGFRFQALGGALVDSGFAASIRCGAAKTFPLEGYFKHPPAEAIQQIDAPESVVLNGADELYHAIKTNKNILVSGGTGTGKTTFINSVIKHIDIDTRIITIEDTKELNLPHKNCVRILKSKTGTDTAKITYKDIINACMRLRPDRLILGEIDIENTVPFLRLLNTGHSGCLSSVHAEDPEQAIDALVLNAELAGLKGNIRQYALQSLDLIVHLRRDAQRNFTAEFKYL